MVLQVLHCPHCHGTDVVRHGTTRQGKQRYRCRTCPEHGRTFLLAYAYAGQSPDVKRQIVDMALNASGIRDTARVLHVSPTTVLKEGSCWIPGSWMCRWCTTQLLSSFPP
jgi:transposase-like protein